MLYKRLTFALKDKGILVPKGSNPVNQIKDFNKDHYLSLYDYNDNHFKQFQEIGSVAGIEDVTTTQLVWDFDSEEIDQAKKDSLILVERLKEQRIDEGNIQIAFSGNKGFHVAINLEHSITVDQFKTATQRLAKDLSTYDISVSDAARVLRLSGTKHPKSGLYKTNFSVSQIRNLSTDKIKQICVNQNGNNIKFLNKPVLINMFLFEKIKEKKEIMISSESKSIDFVHKIRGWSNCKWALYNGYEVKESNRHDKLMCLIATSKALHYPKEAAYYNAKHAYEEGLKRYGGDKKEGWKEDLWRDVSSVYEGRWKGGTYSCKDNKTEWLTQLCQSLGSNCCKFGDTDIVDSDQVFNLFSNYAKNYEDNILNTGIIPLDNECKFMVGTSVGILAPPGVGKTSLSLNLLNYNSVNNVDSVFFSYDMFHSMVYLRLIQKHFNLRQDEIFDVFKKDQYTVSKWQKRISEEYKNVKFCFKSGQTPDEIYETIVDLKNKGVNTKLVVVDYNELVISGVSDPTQASAIVAQRLRQIANDTETCVVTLLQPCKTSSNPSDEITTYTGAKGSGAIAQSLSLMLSLSRPGFSPRHPERDRYFTINALKNRNGPLFTIDCGWNGLTGEITPLTPEDQSDLEQLREEKKAQANPQERGFGV